MIPVALDGKFDPKDLDDDEKLAAFMRERWVAIHLKRAAMNMPKRYRNMLLTGRAGVKIPVMPEITKTDIAIFRAEIKAHMAKRDEVKDKLTNK